MKIWIYLFALIILFTLLMGCGEKKETAGTKALEPNLAETEPNNSPAQAQAVEDGTYGKGFIGTPKDQDWYQIAIPPDSNAILKAVLTGVPGINLKMELFNSDQRELVAVDKNKEDQGEIITNQGLTPGDYFLRVRELWTEGKERKFNDTTAYYLHIHLTPYQADFEFEPNDKSIKSSLIQSEQTIQGYISPYKDVDWFKILHPRYGNHFLELQLTGLENVDLQLEVYDPIEALLIKRNSSGKGGAENILNLGVDPGLEFYYIAVSGGSWHSNEDTTYQLTAAFKPYEGKMEFEPNDRLIRASDIARGDTVKAFFDAEDDVDWYRLQCFAAYPQVARIEVFSVPGVNLKLTIFDDAEKQLWSVNETAEMENEIITNIGLRSSTNYFLKVENLAKSTNLKEKYAIYLEVNRFLAAEEFEPNNQPDAATILGLDTSVKGFIHPIGDVDFYKLDLSNANATRVQLTLRGIVKVNTDMILYDEGLQQIAQANTRQSEESETIQVDIMPGVYYVKVYDNDGRKSNYRDQYQLMVISQP